MSKKLLSALLVLFMVLNLIAGFPVMAEETAGGTAEAISENEPTAEEISENDADPAVYVVEEPAGEAEEPASGYDIEAEAGEQEETAKAQEEQPVLETGDGNTFAANVDGDTAPAADEEPAKAEAEDTPSDPAPTAPDAAKKAVDEKSRPAESSKTAAEPALVGAGEESREPVEVYVCTPGHGRVLVNGFDSGMEYWSTWYKGKEISVEAVPDSGYCFDHWWVSKADGSGQWVGTSTNTLILEADTKSTAYFGLETAYLSITPPAAGTTAAQAPQVSVPDGAGYGLDTEIGFHGPNMQWVNGDTLYGKESLDPDTVFEAGETYYAYVRLRSGADSFSATAGGSTFDTDLQVTGGTKAAQGNFAATQEGGGAYIGIETIIAVTIPEADTHTVTFDMRGHFPEMEPQKVADGEKAVIPAGPVYLDKASDYDTTGLRFSRWNKYAPEDLTYDTFWNTGYPFRDPVTEDMTVYALYETVLSLQAYDITNDVWSVGGTITWDDIYFGSPQTYSNTQTTAILGIRETLTANPKPGYKFVGWSSSKSKDDIEWTDPVYSFINEHRKTLYALFEEEAPKQELSFRIRRTPGSPVPLTELVSSVTVNGEEWQLPSGEMTVEGKIEAGASVSAVIKATDDYIFHSVTEPGGVQTGDFTSDLSQDGSTLTISFTMPEDAAEIGIELTRALTIIYDVNGGTKGPAWPGDLLKYPESFVTITSWTVERALVDLGGRNVATPPANHKYAGLEIIDKNGSHSGAPGQRITGLDLSEGATFKILWEKEKTVTIRWSSIDGVDLMDPIEIPFNAGDKLGDILEAAGYDLYESPFEKDGYIPFGFFYDRPITEFASYDEMQGSDGKLNASTVVNGSMDIYAIMFKEVTEAELAIEQPVCGTSTELFEDGWAWTNQINPPAVSVPGGNCRLGGNGILLPAIWGTDFTDWYEGDFVGGEEYYADVMLEPAFGYKFAAGTDGTFGGEIAVSGGELVKASCSADVLEVNVKVAAVHDPAEPVTENVVEPGCTDPGSHDEVIRCKDCGAKLSSTAVEDAALGHNWGEWTETKASTCTEPGEETRTCVRCSEKETRPIDAAGHNWGEWVVTKEVTETEDGEETRTCARCKETETRTIPHLVVEYRNTKGDGSTWEKDSSAALEFVFNRSIEDEKAFAHFTGLQVDGKDLDAANYTAVSGSVVIKLKPEYLGTLSAGKHTITALFDDGNNPSAEFMINEKKQAAAPTPAKTSGTTTVTKKSSQSAGKESAKSPKTGDSSTPLLWITLLGVSLFVIAKGVNSRRKAKR